MLLDRRLLSMQYGLCEVECISGAINSVRKAVAADILRVLAIPRLQLFTGLKAEFIVIRSCTGSHPGFGPVTLLSFQA